MFLAPFKRVNLHDAKLQKEPRGAITVRLNFRFPTAHLPVYSRMTAVGAMPYSFLNAVEK